MYVPVSPESYLYSTPCKFGTKNKTLREDPLYIGLKEERIKEDAMHSFMDEFIVAFKEVFPKAVLQFEDFSTENAMHYLERYSTPSASIPEPPPVFNDDIQGTGAVSE